MEYQMFELYNDPKCSNSINIEIVRDWFEEQVEIFRFIERGGLKMRNTDRRSLNQLLPSGEKINKRNLQSKQILSR